MLQLTDIDVTVSDTIMLSVLPQNNNILRQRLAQYQIAPTLRLHKVPSDCKLQEYVTKILNVDCTCT